jgi:S-adenosylmethionine:tRNA ribosyltransferase-isomerase
MLTENFNYNLPPHLIAQHPNANPETDRLLVIHRATKSIFHSSFAQLHKFLSPQHLLVFNNTKVIKARLFAHKASGAKIEILLLKPLNPSQTLWTALIKPTKRIREADKLIVSSNFTCYIKQKFYAANTHLVELQTPENIFSALDQHGQLPLPPYIQNQATSSDTEKQYQTIFASSPGSIAAPTAGLHFNTAILNRLKKKHIPMEEITLHIGYDTFKPITSQYLHEHSMHSETYCISPNTASNLKNALENRQIVAIGTTAARTLEAAYLNHSFPTGYRSTNLFISPGYKFHAISGLLTNFHLPKSSLYILVAAFLGKDFLQNIYQEAIHLQYRFYSYGDAMLILP